MTEAEWLMCESPTPMLEFLRGKPSDRKLRLGLCALAQLWPDGYVIEEDTASVRIAERYADGEASLDELNNYRKKQKRVFVRGFPNPVSMRWSSQLLCSRKMLLHSCFELCAQIVRARIVEIAEEPFWERDRPQRHSLLGRERPVFAALLRDIFGNPFRPVAFAPEWRTDTAVALARGMYEARDFGAMPILADALQDAGCDNEDVLTHCRDANATHVRGCWVVDLVLGKE